MHHPPSCRLQLSDHKEPRWRRITRRESCHIVLEHITIFVIALFLSMSLAMSLSWVFIPSLPGVVSGLIRHWVLSTSFKYRLSVNDVVWEGLKGGEHCLRYATRQYTARLVPTPGSVPQDMMKLCKDTPTVIHDQALSTDFCQDLGFGRGVWGFWSVGFQEEDCKTSWSEFVDVGCSKDLDRENAHRRVESRLENLQSPSNWQIMCATTPADISGRHFASPDDCYSSATGTFGVWDLINIPCGEVA